MYHIKHFSYYLNDKQMCKYEMWSKFVCKSMVRNFAMEIQLTIWSTNNFELSHSKFVQGLHTKLRSRLFKYDIKFMQKTSPPPIGRVNESIKESMNWREGFELKILSWLKLEGEAVMYCNRHHRLNF